MVSLGKHAVSIDCHGGRWKHYRLRSAGGIPAAEDRGRTAPTAAVAWCRCQRDLSHLQDLHRHAVARRPVVFLKPVVQSDGLDEVCFRNSHVCCACADGKLIETGQPLQSAAADPLVVTGRARSTTVVDVKAAVTMIQDGSPWPYGGSAPAGKSLCRGGHSIDLPQARLLQVDAGRPAV